MAKMGNTELRAMLAAQHADAMAASGASKLSAARSDATAYYNGDMSKDMPSAPGRSSAVSLDVADVIEGLMPQLMSALAGTDEVVEFQAVGPEDMEAAEQETDYINHVFMNQNHGFLVLYSFIKDALLHKVGVVKVWWEEEEREERETYYDKTVDEYALIVANPDVEVVEHSEHTAEESGMGGGPLGAGGAPSVGSAVPGGTVPSGIEAGVPTVLHDVTVVKKKSYARAKVMGVPPEEFGIERGARTIKDCNYCFHKVVDNTEADLIARGYDAKQIKALATYKTNDNTEAANRDTVDEGSQGGSGEVNPASRPVEIIEHYVRMDYKGDGKPCLYRVTTGGSQGEILKLDGEPDIIEFDAIPFAAMTPVIVTHRFYGRSIADLIMDIQRIKTALLRGLLDNMYMVTNPRVEVSEQHSTENTLDDLLVSRPNGIIRTKMIGGIEWQKVPSVGGDMYPALEYLDQIKETRTGVSKRGQGIEPDALTNQSATAAKIVENASQMRVRLIARIFAETGIRDLFWLLHGTIKKHAQQAAVVRLRKNWVTVDPRQWKGRDDLTVHVGLGTGGRSQRLLELRLIADAQEKLLLGGFTNIVKPEQLYGTAKAMVKAMQEPDTETYFADPKSQPEWKPKPDPKMIELQVKGQLDERAITLKAEIEKLQAQADIATQDRKTQAEIVLAKEKFALERELKLIEHQTKMAESQQQLKMKTETHKQSMVMADKKALKNTPPGTGDAVVEYMDGHAKRSEEMATQMSEAVRQLSEQLAQMNEQMAAPAEIIRDARGKAQGIRRGGHVRQIVRGPDGRAQGLQ